MYTEITTQTSRSLWNYYRDEIHNTNNTSSHGKSFKHRKVVGKKAAQPGNEKAAN